MSSFPDRCVSTRSDKVVVKKENGREFRLQNKNRANVRIVAIDTCLIPRDRKRCDWGFWLDGTEGPDQSAADRAWLVELKGSNLSAALQQILSTLAFIEISHPEEINSRKIVAVVVLSRFSAPKLKTDPRYVKLKKYKKTIDAVIIKNGVVELNTDE